MRPTSACDQGKRSGATNKKGERSDLWYGEYVSGAWVAPAVVAAVVAAVVVAVAVADVVAVAIVVAAVGGGGGGGGVRVQHGDIRTAAYPF